MDQAQMAARVLGPLLGFVALGLIINPRAYQDMAREYVENRGLVFLAGYVTLAGGLIVLILHHAWRPDWTTLVTVLGWLMLVKGALILLAPRPLLSLAQAWSQKTGLIVVQGLVLLAVGLWLSYRAWL